MTEHGTFETLIGEPPPVERGLFANRTLNMRSIGAIGYDMDYTLIHYRTREWERAAFEHLRGKLRGWGWPVEDLRFDPSTFIRGLVFDTELGNADKTNRFGFVMQARHGTRLLPFDEQRSAYGRTIVDLTDDRFIFANTLFSLCKGSMYAQLVDRLDRGELTGVLGYRELFHQIKQGLDEAHMEGQLKAEILADPDRFVEMDPEMPLALLDQRRAGKKLMLITNSEWSYVRPMMAYACDRFLPGEMGWRDLFDIVIVNSRKPDFFSGNSPVFEIVDEEQGLLQPAPRGLGEGAYLGGNAHMVEAHLGLRGDQILYVGDHIYGDVAPSKKVLRWRTALVLRELEEEMRALRDFAEDEARLGSLMAEKERVEWRHCQLRLATLEHGDPGVDRGARGRAPGKREQLWKARESCRLEAIEIDRQIAPLARAAAEVANDTWGLLLRAGNDKSRLARQIERYADLYTSRVSNFLLATPFAFIRGPRGMLPHDVALRVRVDPRS